MEQKDSISVQIDKLVLSKGTEVIQDNFYDPMAEILLAVIFWDGILCQIFPATEKKAHPSYLLRLGEYNTRKIKGVSYNFTFNAASSSKVYFSFALVEAQKIATLQTMVTDWNQQRKDLVTASFPFFELNLGTELLGLWAVCPHAKKSSISYKTAFIELFVNINCKL